MHDYVKAHGVPWSPDPIPGHMFILHPMPFCHNIHRTINEYAKKHPDEDCRWMFEVYSNLEWIAVLEASGASVPNKFKKS